MSDQIPRWRLEQLISQYKARKVKPKRMYTKINWSLIIAVFALVISVISLLSMLKERGIIEVS